MSMFNRGDDDDQDEDVNMFCRRSREEKDRAKERAREIHSGLSSGLFERDEDVLEELKKLKDD